MVKKISLLFFAIAFVFCSFISCNSTHPQEDTNDSFKNMLSSVVAVKFKVEKNGVYETVADGSGVIIDVNGEEYVLTCRHVIYDEENADCEIRLTSYMNESDGGEVGECIWLSESYDLALLKCDNLISQYPELKPIELSNELYPGQSVYAVGNLDGQGLCVTSGIVTREYQSVTLPVPYGTAMSLRLIEHSALTGQGCSGGGLFDKNGKFLGIINSRNVSNGIGWALSAHLVDHLTREAVSKGLTDTLDLGIETKQGNSVLSSSPSVKVVNVLSGSIASAFLKYGDEIVCVEISGVKKQIRTPLDLEALLISANAGEEITFHYVSEKAENSYTFSISEIHLKEII